MLGRLDLGPDLAHLPGCKLAISQKYLICIAMLDVQSLLAVAGQGFSLHANCPAMRMANLWELQALQIRNLTETGNVCSFKCYGSDSC